MNLKMITGLDLIIITQIKRVTNLSEATTVTESQKEHKNAYSMGIGFGLGNTKNR